MPRYAKKMCISFTEIREARTENSVKNSVIRIATYLQLNQQYIEKADMVNFPLHFGPL